MKNKYKYLFFREHSSFSYLNISIFHFNQTINTKRIPPKAVSIIGQMPLKTRNAKLKFQNYLTKGQKNDINNKENIKAPWSSG